MRALAIELSVLRSLECGVNTHSEREDRDLPAVSTLADMQTIKRQRLLVANS